MIRLDLRGVSFKPATGTAAGVRPIDLSLLPGLYYLYGVNGSGKTTLLKGLAGLHAPAAGDVRLVRAGRTLGPGDYKRYMGYSPQEAAVHERMTVRQFLQYVARMRLIPEPLIAARVDEMLGVFDLWACADGRAEQLSVGLKKRLMLAQAMLADPDLLLLDEPLAGADIESQESLRAWMSDEGARRIIIAAHQPSERFADVGSRILYLSGGQLYGPYAPGDLLDGLRGEIYICRMPASHWRAQGDDFAAQGARTIAVKFAADDVIVRLAYPPREIVRELAAEAAEPALEDVFVCFDKLRPIVK